MNRLIAFLFALLPCSAFAVQIPCPAPQANDIVILVAGESNAASYGDVAYNPMTDPATGNPAISDVSLVIGTNACYPLFDPIPTMPTPAAPGSGGSIWSRFSGIFHAYYPAAGRIIFVNIAYNGVEITTWAQGAASYPKIAQAFTALSANGYAAPRAMLFMDGEADALYGISAATDTAAIQSMADGIRSLGYTFPIVVSITTKCDYTTTGADAGADLSTLTRWAAAARFRQSAVTQSALANITDITRNVMVGPNTDMLGATSRWDHCHLSSNGQWDAAQMWVDDLVAKGILP